MVVNPAAVTGAARSYIEVVFRRKWLFLVPVIVFVSVSIGVGFVLPPRYRSEAILGLKEEQSDNPHLKGVTAVTPFR